MFPGGIKDQEILIDLLLKRDDLIIETCSKNMVLVNN